MYILYVNKYTHHGGPCEMMNVISHDDFISDYPRYISCKIGKY